LTCLDSVRELVQVKEALMAPVGGTRTSIYKSLTMAEAGPVVT
jgi:hypothetical protein